MSLKAVHVAFIAVSTLFAAGFGIWSISQEGLAYLVLGIFSLISAAALVVYGGWFLKKMRHVGYLAIATFSAWTTEPALACAVCFGQSDSPMMQGVEASILFMAGLTYMTILGGVAAFIVLRVRARHRMKPVIEQVRS